MSSADNNNNTEHNNSDEINADKRRHPRLMREETLSVRPMGEPGDALQDAVYCSTLDMSASGLRLQTEVDWPEGQQLDIWIALLDELGTYHLHGQLNWIRAAADGGYLAGVEVLNDSEDLRAWQELF